MDDSFLQRAYARLEKKKEKKVRQERQQEKIVIRASRERTQERENNGAKLIQEREERRRTLREQYQNSAVGMMEAFAKTIAPAFQAFIEEHGDKLEGARIMMMCSKSDYSGAHSIVCLANPKTKQVLHRVELQKLAEEAKMAGADPIIEPEPINLEAEPATVAEPMEPEPESQPDVANISPEASDVH